MTLITDSILIAANTSVGLSSALTGIDWVIVGGYFTLLILLAIWVMRQNQDSTSDYFLAGRSLGWFVIGASIFASNIGSEHLVGLAGSGCTDGVAMAHFELHAWCLLVLAWVLVPFYARSRVFTMPEFLERRYSPTNRWVLSLISLVAYVLTKVAVGIFAGGVVFTVLLPELHIGPFSSFWIGSILVIVLTGIYTTLGGLRAVAYTEAMQTIVLIVGSILVTVYGLAALGEVHGGDGSISQGWHNLHTINGQDSFNLWKPIVPEGVENTWLPVIEYEELAQATQDPVAAVDAAIANPADEASFAAADTKTRGPVIRQAWYFNGNYPWLGMLIAAPIIGLWYWCTDQYIVQRALGAPNEAQARRGSIFAGLLKLLPVFIFIIPGMICLALARSGHEGLGILVTQDGEVVRQEAQAAFPLMVRHVLPEGIRGIVVAGLLSALMSSLAGVFNACSTLFTMDFYSKFRKQASERELVWVGRCATITMILIGLAWLPVIQNAKGLYDYLQGVQGYLAPPIFVVFFCGVFHKRLNAKGCLAALIVGFALGVFRLAVDTPVALMDKEYTEGSFFWVVNHIYFQYYSMFITLICVIVMYAVSYTTKLPDSEQIKGLAFGTISEEEKAKSRRSWNFLDVAGSVVLVLCIIAAYLYFSTLIGAKPF